MKAYFKEKIIWILSFCRSLLLLLININTSAAFLSSISANFSNYDNYDDGGRGGGDKDDNYDDDGGGGDNMIDTSLIFSFQRFVF